VTTQQTPATFEQPRGESAAPASNFAGSPDLATWMSLTAEEIAERVEPFRLTALISLDGTRRWAYLHEPASRTDWRIYTEASERAMLALLERFFTLGVQTVIVPILYPPNFARGAEWLRAALGPNGMGRLANPEVLATCARWGARARLGGTWTQAEPWAVDMLAALDRQLAAGTPDGERLIIWECDAGDIGEAMLRAAVEVGPRKDAVLARFYPAGLSRVDLAIKDGKLNTVNSLASPLLLNGTDLYVITNLMLDLSESQLRAILHDHVVLRRAGPKDGVEYTDEDLDKHRAWYLEESPRVLGLGELGAGGVWRCQGGIEIGNGLNS
jgi:hypothetical protein